MIVVSSIKLNLIHWNENISKGKKTYFDKCISLGVVCLSLWESARLKKNDPNIFAFFNEYAIIVIFRK